MRASVLCFSIYLYAHLVRATSQLIDSLGWIKLAMSRATKLSTVSVDLCVEFAECRTDGDDFGAKSSICWLNRSTEVDFMFARISSPSQN